MPAPLRRIAALAAVAAALAGGLAGCGGGDGEDLAAGLTPAELLQRSADAAAEAESFRIALDATGSLELSRGAGGLAGLLSGPLELSAEGPVAPPDRASLDVSVQLARLPLQLNVSRVGDEVYASALGQDYRLDLPAEQVELLDLGALYPTLVSWTEAPSDAGRQEIGGEETAHVTGRIDARRALADLAPLLGAEAPSPAAARAALREGTVDAWVGVEDLLPRRVRVSLLADGARVAEGVGRVDLDLSADLSEYGEPVEITPPPAPQELDLDQLGSLVGG